MKKLNKNPTRRHAVGSMIAMLGAPFSSMAQISYPSRPVKFIVPFPAGGGADIVARLIAQKLTISLGQPVVVDNKGGGSTIIGSDQLAKASPDGHTFGMITDSHVVNPHFFKKLPYDSFADFSFVSQLVSVPLMLVANPTAGITSVKQLVDAAKSRPNVIDYASTGNATPHHLAMEWFKSLAGINLNHVPYKGVAPAVTDAVAGHVQVMFSGIPTVAPHIHAGRLIPLGVSSGKRLPRFPNVPSISEVIPQFDYLPWYGAAAPAGTPRDIVERLSTELLNALRQQDVKERLDELGVLPAHLNPQDFSALVRKGFKDGAEMVKITNIKAE